MKLDRMDIRGGENGRVTIDGETLTLTANAATDWFHHPADEFRKRDVISLAMEVHQKVFSLAARVSVGFQSAYDAGALFLEVDEENWAKLAFEYSADSKPTMVSVVTRTTSDDADGPNRPAEPLWLRLYCDGETVAFHFSEDGRHWRFLRWFALPNIGARPVRVGFGVQSPTGPGCTACFDNIAFSHERIGNIRDGS